MSEPGTELRRLAAGCQRAVDDSDTAEFAAPLARLESAVESVARSWSGSNLGYHSRVYYADLEVPPPGAHFDVDWGLMDRGMGTTGDWQEYTSEDVVSRIYDLAEVESLDDSWAAAKRVTATWTTAKQELASIFAAGQSSAADSLIDNLAAEATQVGGLSPQQALRTLVSRPGTVITRDMAALGQGWLPAPHQVVEADVMAIRSAYAAAAAIANVATRAANHLERLEASRASRGQGDAPRGDRVFIGHGQSAAWRELKDFINDRLGLTHDEYNRVPVAGVTNIARLSEMLDAAGIALLVLTAEDEQSDGTARARQNVVHEAGLFQGRLGFTRAIVLLEDGCEEFSNIQGLGQIRFPAGRIAASFEEVRQVLEREELLQ